MENIGIKISPSHGFSKFRNLANAKSFADKGSKPMVIFLGDDQHFWAVSLA